MATTTENCVYSNPVRYDGTVPTLPTHVFFFRNKVCDSNASTSINTTLSAYNPTTTISSSTSIQVYGAMSAGEVLIILLLFIMIILNLSKTLFSALERIKTKKKWLGYERSEVEIREDL